MTNYSIKFTPNKDFNIDKWVHYANKYGIGFVDSFKEPNTLLQIQRIPCTRCGATKIENTECEWCGM